MYRLVVLLGLMLMAVFPAAAQEREAVVTLERQPCFGACPVYSVTIYDDGTVVYNGERFVDVEGEQTTNIGADAVDELVATFEEAGYFEWEDEYTEYTVTDLPYVITSVTRDGETKRINRYTGDSSAPVLLPYLEYWVDMVVNTAQWTGAEVSPPTNMMMNSPVVTLERQPCFGMCPVYTLAIYEDGTVVYVGINHVSQTGIRTATIDTQEVEWLAEQMVMMGYLEWDDEYTYMLVTDQPTVITSLAWDDDYHRIVRYDGDPNAPVGLVRIEDRIDAAANSDQWVMD